MLQVIDLVGEKLQPVEEELLGVDPGRLLQKTKEDIDIYRKEPDGIRLATGSGSFIYFPELSGTFRNCRKVSGSCQKVSGSFPESS